MRESSLCSFLKLGVFAGAVCALSLCAAADEIRLKDGKKLNGVIVGYEDNMFKVKTDFGFVLVEKDKIAKIVPSTPEETPAAKKDAAQHAAKPGTSAQLKTEPAVASASDTAAATNASAKSADATKSAPKVTNTAVKPEVPVNTTATVAAPAIKGSATVATTSGLAAAPATTGAAPPPKEPEVPANREEVQGNLYTNYTHGFRMYKAPSWSLIEEARGALPNAIVAMGTYNESSLLVVGQEKTKDPLAAA